MKNSYRIFIGAVSLFTAISVEAGVCNPALTRQLHRYRQTKDSTIKSASSNESKVFIPLVVRLGNPTADSELTQMGGIVYYRRDDLALVNLPADVIDLAEKQQLIKRAEMSSTAVPLMDMSLTWTGLDKVRNAEQLNMTYTGKGVVTGFSDIGFDPNHINFRNTDGTSRIGRLVEYRASLAERKVVSDDEIQEYVTDDASQTHATHVGGIMAGRFDGLPYSGVATESTIVATMSELQTAEFLAGVEDIIAYADENKMPAVANLSLSNETGPRDGTTLACQYLSKMSLDIPICISAGNNGDRNMYLGRTFDKDASIATTMMDFATWTGMTIHGCVDVWGSDDSPIEVEIVIYDMIDKKELAAIAVDSDYFILASDEHLQDNAVKNDIFNRYFNGVVEIPQEVNSENNRRNMTIYYEVDTRSTTNPNGWADQEIGFRIKGKKGQRIDCYGEGLFFRGTGTLDYVAGTNDGEINDLACAEGVICVGSMTTRTIAPVIGGGSVANSGTIGEITKTSGYATLANGRVMPDIVAPGNSIVSSVSTPNVGDHAGEISLSAQYAESGRTNYWQRMSGTSMSSPYVAGAIALMLEANNELGSDEIKKIIMETAKKPQNPSPQWGASGTIDIHAALCKAVATSDVASVKTDKTPFITRNGDQILIDCDGRFECVITDVAGKVCLRQSARDKTTVTLPMSPGLYILTVNSDKADALSMKYLR